ncbi:hypothetical protein ACIBF6_37965 [Streptosporangium amethystogenes]|uniref:hypothetical protein n=1 Tax=Streptosporangium amethystogenes TaxID=2002 RepID=UPI0037BCBC31
MKTGALGDVGVAARALLVPPDTVRYRLDDPDGRVVLDLRPRLWRREEPGTA